MPRGSRLLSTTHKINSLPNLKTEVLLERVCYISTTKILILCGNPQIIRENSRKINFIKEKTTSANLTSKHSPRRHRMLCSSRKLSEMTNWLLGQRFLIKFAKLFSLICHNSSTNLVSWQLSCWYKFRSHRTNSYRFQARPGTAKSSRLVTGVSNKTPTIMGARLFDELSNQSLVDSTFGDFHTDVD